MSKIVVACAQIECQPGDIAANLRNHLDAIEKAATAGANLVVFPELSLTDYLPVPDVAQLALTIDAPEIRTLAEAAGHMAVSFGLIEGDGQGRSYNSQVLVENGRVVHVHRKLNLPTYGQLREGHYYAAGETLTLAAMDGGWQAATLICADSWNPALPWLAAIQHANLLIQPIASARGVVDGGFDNPGGWEINLRHTAMTYGLPTIMVNHCGRRENLDFWGGSRILDAHGRELARAGEESTLILAELDIGDVAAARRNLPTIRDADPARVRAELERISASAFQAARSVA